MKFLKLTGVFVIGLSMIISTSCVSDFLEQPLDSVITVDSVFNNPDNAMKAFYQVYSTCVVNGLINGYTTGDWNDSGCRDAMLSNVCDEGTMIGNNAPKKYTNGTWNATNQDEFDIYRVMAGIRNAVLYVENIDKTPYAKTATVDWTEQYKNQCVAEVKILRALMYFEMVKRYGGVPLMTKLPKIVIAKEGDKNIAKVDMDGTRRSLKSTFDYIIKDCEEAIPYLSNSFSAAESGRISKGAGLALKARTLLYMASPLFNTDTPYLPFDGADSLICLGNYDQNRWQLAADANRELLEWASAFDYKLLSDPALGPGESYNYATGLQLDVRNKETILMDRSHTRLTAGCMMARMLCPIWYSWGNCAQSVNIDYIQKMYYNATTDQPTTLAAEGKLTEFITKMKAADPRLEAVAWFPGSAYSKNGTWTAAGGGEVGKMYLRVGGYNGTLTNVGNGGTGVGMGEPAGPYFKKFINLTNATTAVTECWWPIFRLAEFYLNYAEALNEVNPTHPDIITNLNIIRKRAGLQDLKLGNPVYDQCFGNKDKMRSYIQRERAIELYGEEHRPFDVRRWKIASQPGVMGGDFNKIVFYENSTTKYWDASAKRYNNTDLVSYKIEKYETRVWKDNMYLYPFPQGEVNKGFIKQNPGW